MIVLKETSGPRHYRFGKTVTYVTRSGKVLDEDVVRTRVKVGVPVRSPLHRGWRRYGRGSRDPRRRLTDVRLQRAFLFCHARTAKARFFGFVGQ
jgi:hypothetical protein